MANDLPLSVTDQRRLLGFRVMLSAPLGPTGE
jgi:hypothetical protein